jgi:hypothetical protein
MHAVRCAKLEPLSLLIEAELRRLFRSAAAVGCESREFLYMSL